MSVFSVSNFSEHFKGRGGLERKAACTLLSLRYCTTLLNTGHRAYCFAAKIERVAVVKGIVTTFCCAHRQRRGRCRSWERVLRYDVKHGADRARPLRFATPPLLLDSVLCICEREWNIDVACWTSFCDVSADWKWPPHDVCLKPWFRVKIKLF